MKKAFFVENFLSYTSSAIIPVLFLGLLSFFLIKPYITEKAKTEHLLTLEYCQRAYEMMFEKVDTLNDSLSYNPTITSDLKRILRSNNMGLTTYMDYRSFSYISNILFYTVNANENIFSLYIYFDNGLGKYISSQKSTISHISRAYDAEWLDSYRTRDADDMIWMEKRSIQPSTLSAPKQVYTIYRRMTNASNKPDDGLIVCNLDMDWLTKFVDNIILSTDDRPNVSILVLDESGQIVVQSTNSLGINDHDLTILKKSDSLGNVIRINDTDYVAFSVHSDFNRFRYISLIEKSELYWLPNKIKQAVMMATALCLILGIFISFRTMKKNYNNLDNLYKMINSTKEGTKFPPPLKEEGIYNTVFNSVLRVFIERNVMDLQLSEKKHKLFSMSVLALQSQINPHFLYNTLETIYWKSMAFTGKPNELSEMISNLSVIMQYSFDDATIPVELSKEFDVLEGYITIQKIRHSKKLDVLWDVEEEVLKCQVPKLILQPIVENSLKHGFHAQKEYMIIKVRAYIEDERLILKIVDNGFGMSFNILKKIREEILTSEKDGIQDGVNYKCKNIGLNNVHSRIRLIYGNRYGLKISSLKKVGTAVKIVLPVMYKKHDIFDYSLDDMLNKERE